MYLAVKISSPALAVLVEAVRGWEEPVYAE